MEINKIRCDQNAEKALLGIILQDQTLIATAAQYILNPFYFYGDINRLVWETILKMVSDNAIIDPITLHHRLIKNFDNERITWDDISDMTNNFGWKAEVETYAKIIAEEYLAREMVKNSARFIDTLQERRNETVGKSWVDHYTTSNKLIYDNPQKCDQSILTLAEELDKVDTTCGWGISWGLEAMDFAFEKIVPSSIIVLGGRPGHGKSLLAMQMIDAWLESGKRVLLHSLEMTWREHGIRRLARYSGIPQTQIRLGYGHSKNQTQHFVDAMNAAQCKIFDNDKNLKINDKSNLTASQIALSIRVEHDTKPLDFVVVDHIGLVKNECGSGRDDRFLREEGLQVITGACKERAIIPVILSQLSRGIEKDGRTTPLPSDLRELGALEEIATNVIFVYNKYAVTNDRQDAGKIDIIQAKARHGRRGKISADFYPDIAKIGG